MSVRVDETGMTARPRQSMVRVAWCCRSTSSDGPTATILPPSIATAPSSMMARPESMVTTVPRVSSRAIMRRLA